MSEQDATDSSWPPRLTVDTARILEVLTGDRFYSTKDAALREAVLNSIDACTRGKAKDSSATPTITVDFDDNNLLVTVSDNGDGMAQDEMSDLFTTIGASIAQIASDVEIVGEFGIGVVSYFLVCEKFEIQSSRAGHQPIGVAFDRTMLDGTTQAQDVAPTRTEQGTTLSLHVRDQPLYKLLVDRFPYWFRGVVGLTAARHPSGEPVEQGSPAKPATPVTFDLPEWAEAADLGPPIGFDRWAHLDGNARVDVLYRGVYVETQTVNGLWGMQGTISVHPKRLKPRLNREGFVAEDLQRDVIPFLQSIHPAILNAGLSTLSDSLDDPAASWSLNQLVALWLAVPRAPEYQAVVGAWDDFFRTKTLFRRLTVESEQEEVSLNDLVGLSGPIYLAADNLTASSDIVRSAVRVLRAQGASVVQGISRDTSYLSLAPSVGQSTADLLLSYFSQQLAEVIRVETVAERVLGDSVRIGELFSSEPRVVLMRLGDDGAPLVVASGELWLNLDTPGGRAIVQSVCEENRGRLSLLVACHTHADQHVGLLSPFIHAANDSADRLGLVTREYLRGLAS